MSVRPLACCLLVALAACTSASPARESFTIYAASSLQDALPDLADAFAATDGGARPVLAFDGSSRLRAQIELGAPADLFLSADEATAASLIDHGLAAERSVVIAANRVVLVVPSSGGRVARWQQLAAAGTRIVTADDAVPITHYAQLAVARLAGLPDAPTGFAAAYRRNVVSHEDNVRAVLAKVELGEADAALVYASDALSSTAVTVVPLPIADVNASYAGVLVRNAPHPDVARRFLGWLSTADALMILRAHGFSVP